MDACLRLVDLSWPLRPGMAVFPGDPPLTLAPLGGYGPDGFLSHLAALPLHCGTHVDAPGHVLPGAPMLADLPPERFCGPGALLDLRARPGLAVTPTDLAPHLAGLAGAGFALLSTGDEERWGDADYYTAGAHLTPEAAAVLAALPGLKGVGLDAGSADAAGLRDLPAHRALLGAGRIIVENLRGLAQLAGLRFRFWCLPVFGADGSPVRAVAELPGPEAQA